MKRDIIELYSYFVSKLYSGQSYEFFSLKVTERHRRIIIDFLCNLSMRVDIDDVDTDYLFDYCSFQFEYMFSKMPRYKESRIPLQQIFNKTGIERWLNRTDGYMYYVGESLQEKGIDRSEINISGIELKSPTELIDIEEKEKERYHNQDNGFAHCIISTSLFNHKSMNCQMCRYKHACKALLKKQYLPIYVDRGYVQTRDSKMQSV
jgi:hypothetical protein